MNPRWKAYLNYCEANDEKPKARRYKVFIFENLSEFCKANGTEKDRRLTDEEHQQFDEFLFEKYPTKEIDNLARFFQEEYPHLIEVGTPVDNTIRLIRKGGFKVRKKNAKKMVNWMHQRMDELDKEFLDQKSTKESCYTGEPEYTPGPWRVRKDITSETLVCSDSKKIICGIHQKNLNRLNETEANAKLIAAAPDLLEAAKEYLKALESETYYFDGRLLDTKLNLKKAIQKAEGKD